MTRVRKRRGSPVVEALEQRLLLSASWQVIPDAYLDVGNEYDYTTGAATSVTKVTGTQDVSGVTCKVLETTVGTSVMDVWQALTPDNVVTYGAQTPGLMTMTVLNNDPMEALPRIISTTDKHRVFGHGQFQAVGPGGTTWDLTQQRDVTYLGTEKLTLTVNGQSHTFDTVKALIVHTETNSANGVTSETDITAWFLPGFGAVKNDQQQVLPAPPTAVVRSTLTATNVPVPMPAPAIVVLGKAVQIANGESNPGLADGTDFGNTCTLKQYAETETFTIQNTGTAALKLTGKPRVAVSGANAGDFVVTAQPAATVAAGRSTAFRIKFCPSVVGLRTATVTIADNDGSGPFTFQIQGTGVTPSPEISLWGNKVEIANGENAPSAADWTDFGSVLVPKKYVTRTFTIKNTGTAKLDLTGIIRVAVSGADAGDFIVTAQPPAALAPGGSATFKIKFFPSTAGLRTATVTIANDDADNGDGVENPFVFQIQGTGSP